MEVKKCPKGHYYDAGSLAECPVCAAENQAPTAMKVCPKGHYYNSSIYTECPLCASGKGPVTVKLEKCSNGHYYDPMITPECPECAKLATVDLDRLDTDGGFTENYLVCPDLGETALFLAFDDMRFRFWTVGGNRMAQFHWRMKPDAVCKPMVFGKVLELSEDDFDTVINSVLKFLYTEGVEEILSTSAEGEPAGILIVNTWLMRWNRSWKNSITTEMKMGRLCDLLKRHIAWIEEKQPATPWTGTIPIVPYQNPHMELKYATAVFEKKRNIHIKLCPWSGGIHAQMDVGVPVGHSRILNLTKEVFIPENQWELMQQIYRSGISQTILRCIPETPQPVIGCGEALISFRFRWNNLDFGYEGIIRPEEHEDAFVMTKTAAIVSRWMNENEQNPIPEMPAVQHFTLP